MFFFKVIFCIDFIFWDIFLYFNLFLNNVFNNYVKVFILSYVWIYWKCFIEKFRNNDLYD